ALTALALSFMGFWCYGRFAADEVPPETNDSSLPMQAPKKLAPKKLAPEKLAPEKLGPEKMAPDTGPRENGPRHRSLFGYKRHALLASRVHPARDISDSIAFGDTHPRAQDCRMVGTDPLRALQRLGLLLHCKIAS
ncbi:MAG: hypothetical protein NT168_09095, partial [Planctomycetota bacterium]|nr:hypothetical protein [Planctomycetota bacterium]